MRKLTVFLTIVFALAPAVYHAQDAQRSASAFRASVDLIVVNVVALDKRGQPVEDLGPRDFSVKIDGRQREVVSAELVKAGRGVPAGSPPAATTETLVSTNALPAGGRLVAVAVDQTLITPGSIKPLLNTASQFIGKLTTDDRVALVTFPEPGPHVDFTTDKARVRQALERVVGQGYSQAFGARFLKRVIDERIKLPISEHWKEAARFEVVVREGELAVEPTAVAARLIDTAVA